MKVEEKVEKTTKGNITETMEALTHEEYQVKVINELINSAFAYLTTKNIEFNTNKIIEALSRENISITTNKIAFTDSLLKNIATLINSNNSNEFKVSIINNGKQKDTTLAELKTKLENPELDDELILLNILEGRTNVIINQES